GADQQAEFVAAQAAGEVVDACRGTQDVGPALQHTVADQVAVLVVDALEAVAVDQQQAATGQQVVAAALFQVQLESAAVGQPGELVGAGELLGLVEPMGGGAQGVQGGLQVDVAAAQ